MKPTQALLGSTAMLLTACANVTGRMPPRAISLPFATDTSRIEAVDDGVTRLYAHTGTGPWGIHVLSVELSACYSVVAVKGAEGAVGREKTSTLLQNLKVPVVGGVNADFFSLSGFQGVPTGALISRGRVIVGPGAQPVLAIDSSGVPKTVVLMTNGSVNLGGRARRFSAWNRPAANGLAYYDANWGTALDTASSIIEVVLNGTTPARVVSIDTTKAGATIPRRGGVLVAGRTADSTLRADLLALRVGDTVRVSATIEPFHPREAVGGRPMLVRDSVVVPEVDTEGQASFQARNPRTAVGIARDGKRLILVVVDGRQKPYSDGMTLRELATLMLALGSRDAINLDGGGSSALVYSDPASPNTLRVANKPSDPTGERAVGDALAIVEGCGSR